MRLLTKIVKPVAVFGLSSFCRIAHGKLFEKILTVFCFHDVTDAPSNFSQGNDLNVKPKVFDLQISFIKKKYNVISPEQLLYPSLPPYAALLTFDDGFKSFFNNAIPILEKHQIPAIIFLNMGPIRGETNWAGLIDFLCKRQKFIDYLKTYVELEKIDDSPHLSCSQLIVERYIENEKEDIHELVSHYVGDFADETDLECASRHPYIFYGNHTYTHLVSSLITNEELLNDVRKNSELLKEYPNYIDYFSFPFGQPGRTFTQAQVQLLLDSGIKKVFYSSGSLNQKPSASFLDRISLISGDDSPNKIRFRVSKSWLSKL